MSRTHLRWALISITMIAVLLAACQPASPTPTPTPVPTATTAPATAEATVAAEAATAEATAAATAMAPATEAATAEMTEAAATEAPAMAVTEAATAEMTEAPAEMAAATAEMTEAPAEMAAATAAATAEMAAATEAATAEMTEMATPEATMEAASSASSTAMGANVMVSPDQEVIIGLATGLSGEGIAPLGIDIQRGAELALTDRPTVTVDGKTFNVKLDVQDDQCSADGGQAVANRFASEEGVVGVVGPMCSSACRAAAPIFDAADYTSISPSCTAPDLTTSGYSSFNRSVVGDTLQGAIAANYIYTVLGIHSIATIHDGSPYGEGLVSVVTKNFEALGGKVVSADAVQVGDTDFRGLLDDIAQNNPELIYFGGFAAEAARLIEQRADAGLENVPFMGADGIQGTEVIKLAGEQSKGVYATAAIAASSQALTDFIDRYVQVYGEQPPAPYHATAYDAVNLLLNAVEAVGKVDAKGDLVVLRDDVRNYIRSFKDYHGLTGVLNADGTGETSISDIGVFQVENGQFAQIYTGSKVNGEVQLTPYTPPPTEEATMEATAETTEAAMEAAPAAAATEAPTAEATAEATASS